MTASAARRTLGLPQEEGERDRSAESISSFIFLTGFTPAPRVALFSMIALALFSLIATIAADDSLALFHVIAWP